MLTARQIEAEVLAILEKTLQRPVGSLQESLDLSSIQTLNVVAFVEQKFLIEIEDDLIFHGLFACAENLTTYICQQRNISS